MSDSTAPRPARRSLATLFADVFADARAVARSVAREWTPFLAGVLTLAVGLGANGAVLTVLRASMAPVPYPGPEALVHVSGTSERTEGAYPLSYLDLSEMQALDDVLQVAIFSTPRSLNLLGAGEGSRAERVTGAMVSASYFDVLRVDPVLGRPFGPEHEQIDAQPVALISHGLWTRRYAQDPGVPGRTMNIDGRSFEILGVMPEGFGGLRHGDDVWMPVTQAAAFYGGYYVEARPFRWLGGVARLRPGVGIAQASDALDAHMAQSAESFPQTNEGIGAALEELRAWMFEDATSGLVVTWIAALALFLIACANVASIQYGRAMRATGTAAVRAALGASPVVAARPIWIETALVTVAGVAVGAAMASMGVGMLARFDAVALPDFVALQPDWSVFAAMSGTALVLLPVIAWLPAGLHAAADPATALGRVGRSSGAGGPAPWLLNGQIALAVALVAISTVTLRAFAERNGTNLGMDPTGVVTARLDLKNPRFAANDAYRSLVRSLHDEIAVRPGVESVAFVGPALPTDDWNSTTVSLEESVAAGLEPQGRDALYHRVTPGYFTTLGIPMLQGRDFTFEESDPQSAEPVVIVSRSMARTWWPDGEVLGRRMKFGGPGSEAPWMRVVGVVEDAANRGFDDGPGLLDLYFSILQFPARQPPLLNVVARMPDASDPATMLASAQEALAPEAPLFDVRPLDSRFRQQLRRERSNTWLLLAFSALATLVCAVGTYGVTSLSVARARHGHGVRMALGAPRLRLFGEVVRRTVLEAVPGVVAGAAVAVVAGRILFDRTGSVVLVSLIAAGILGTAVCLAALPPAGRVLRREPRDVLEA